MALTRLWKVGDEARLDVSEEEIKAMGIVDVPAFITDGGHTTDQVISLCYLGLAVTQTKSIEWEVTIRIGKAGSAERHLGGHHSTPDKTCGV